jgi:hypothetical protein
MKRIMISTITAIYCSFAFSDCKVDCFFLKNNSVTTTGANTVVISFQNEKKASNSPTEKSDTIIKLGGKKIPCTVLKENAASFTYTLPEKSELNEMPKKEVQTVIYRNGRKRDVNKPVFQVIDQSHWEAVLITENPSEVEGLYKVGAIKTTAASDSRSPEAAKTSATIRLQKKAANMGALIVLIVDTELKGGYGEIPGCDLIGIAYSDKPPIDTAAVSKAIRQVLEKKNQKQEGEKKKSK